MLLTVLFAAVIDLFSAIIISNIFWLITKHCLNINILELTVVGLSDCCLRDILVLNCFPRRSSEKRNQFSGELKGKINHSVRERNLA